MDPNSFPAELTAMFREELRDNVQVISNALREIEAGAAPERIATLFRDIGRMLHNIKGAATSLGLESIGTVAHAAETLLLSDADRATLTEGTVTGLVYTITWLQDASGGETPDPAPLLERLGASTGAAKAAPRPEPQPRPAPVQARREEPSPQRERTPSSEPTSWHQERSRGTGSAAVAPEDEVVRVSGALLEQVLSPLTALISERTDGRFRVDRLLELCETAATVAQRAVVGPLHAEDVGKLRGLSADLSRETERLRESVRRTGQAVSTLEEQVHGMRLVSLAALEGALSLAAREAALRTSKQVSFAVHAAGVQVDRRVLEALRSPLLHLVRNAVDHGIESPDARRAAGKQALGRVVMRVIPRGEVVEIAVEDDGAGVDLGRVRRVAVDRGLIRDAPSERMAYDEVLGVLTHPGFSTKERADELSGRGIGMDVVAKTVRELGGTMVLDSDAGKRTRFTLTIPVSVLTTRVLFVRANGRIWALPLASVEGTLRVSQANVYTVDGKLCVDVGGVPAAVRQLGGALAELSGSRKVFPAVALAARNGKVALVVDDILNEEQVVVRPLGPPVRHVRGVLGTTVAESGAVVVVLSAAEVVQPDFAAASVPAARVARRQSTVLVVDDSITTRTLERHIFERNGFLVRLASDGVEALIVLRTEHCDLVVADVEMPRLDGIGLVRAMRSDPALEATPVILVTSLASEDDQRRGLAAGAQAYVIKGRFDQEKLLATVRELLDRKA